MSRSDHDETHPKELPERSARIEALATLPVFFKLGGKRATVAGGGEPALWKAELLAAAGANVDVYGEAFADGFRHLSLSPPGGSVTLNSRRWRAQDVDGAAIAVGAFENDTDASAFASAARDAGVPVNIIDRPAFCDFQFGAIVNRSPLVVAISTDGAAPVFGQAIRSLIEVLLPEGFRRWAEAARRWRRQTDRLGATAAAKRRFWDRFADLAIREADRAPTDADLERLLSRGSAQSGGAARQSVTMINVGDDSLDVLTLGAVRALRGADLVVFDNDVPVAVLGFARREARRVPVAHSGAGETSFPQGLVGEIIRAASDGGRVVWLSATTGSKAAEAATRDGMVAAELRAAGLTVATPPSLAEVRRA
jgi:uroporphyrin-III C-methyltransferase/precorrin-2 dehydrogenase/sirohydrochlorin ferrochelatase